MAAGRQEGLRGVGEDEGKADPGLWRTRTDQDREREAHLIGSGFLLLDTLLVDSHGSSIRRGGGMAGSVNRAVRVSLRTRMLWWGVIGERREDGRWEYGLKRGEHLDGTRSLRGELFKRSRQREIMEMWVKTISRRNVAHPIRCPAGHSTPNVASANISKNSKNTRIVARVERQVHLRGLIRQFHHS